ncbi:hypothetical protein VitviT2T_028204 [Vitis vinifera]|uniref:Uncharacterized protein n=1 Tax=Vitis vinifera TaxID=29760 RepID=A0ABY9DSK8_VITVI|nr:hypothetical protein VitviT2T_028204 [Vitis vinifera]
MARRTALAKRLELYRSALVEIEEGVLLESLVQSFKRVQVCGCMEKTSSLLGESCGWSLSPSKQHDVLGGYSSMRLCVFSHAAIETGLCTNSFKDATALLMAACGEENPFRV